MRVRMIKVRMRTENGEFTGYVPSYKIPGLTQEGIVVEIKDQKFLEELKYLNDKQTRFNFGQMA